MWLRLDAAVYARVHDLIVPCRAGTTQIDHVLVSVYGVFVVETKNMSGWIFGDERARKWTQSIYGKKFQFQNPLHQNFRHVKALEELLGLPDSVIHPVVFFIGECEFKTPMPANVLNRGLSRYIQSFTARVFTPEEAAALRKRLLDLKANPAAGRTLHIQGLKGRHNGETCPKCGSALVMRTARRGANAGGSFYGCTGYPKCRYTRNA